jgi:ubiquinone/menaquinone biosynthesis C-methylase UbiE
MASIVAASSRDAKGRGRRADVGGRRGSIPGRKANRRPLRGNVRTPGQTAATRGQDRAPLDTAMCERQPDVAMRPLQRHFLESASPRSITMNSATQLGAVKAPQSTTTTPAVDLAALKGRQQAAWASGNYAMIGTTLQIVGEQLAESCDLKCDEAVLDVAAGNGNATLAAARRGCKVTSTDYVSTLLDHGAERARAEQLDVKFQVADAEALPFADATFDAALSTFGVMFSPDHAKAAAELARVCRRGGRIGLANWTPDGFVGQMFKVLGRQLPPPAGVQPPSLWGVESHLQSLFGERAADIAVTPRMFNFRYRSAAHFIDVFRTWYGPVHKAFAALPADKSAALESDLTTLLDSSNRAGKGTLVVPSEYLEIVITRR